MRQHQFKSAYGEYADGENLWCHACEEFIPPGAQEGPCPGPVDPPCHVCRRAA